MKSALSGYRKAILNLIGLALALTMLAACVPGTPGIIGNTNNCNGNPVQNGRLSMAAFAGHNVVVYYSWCYGLSGIHYIAPPAVSTPTSNPLGGFYESVQVARLPYVSFIDNYKDGINFDIRQQIFHIAGTQTFTFYMTFEAGWAVSMCMGRTCIRNPALRALPNVSRVPR